MSDKKHISYFTYSDIEKRVNKKLKSILEDLEDKTDEPNATFKKQLCAIASYYINVMDSLQTMKKKEATDKRKIEKLEKDVKSMYYLFGITLDHVVKEHQSNLIEIRNFGSKKDKI